MGLTAGEWVSLAIVGTYAVLFGMFLRLFAWKRYADRMYWRHRPVLNLAQVQERAAAAGRPLPFFSVLVPARDEADVIAATVAHLASLEYPHDCFEIVVVTDEKELLQPGREGPTTQERVEEIRRTLAGTERAVPVRHVVVPVDFDGALGGRCTGRTVPSTKGRALNYAMRYIDPRCAMLAFYDAESQPDRQVLLQVAWRLLADAAPEMLQGPVFQVRNFHRMGPICKVASLYQAVAHDWYLPVLMRKLPFVGGTNLFVAPRVLRAIGGFDPTCLTEDLELGLRAHLLAGVWPAYLPVVSSEQTPTTFPAFFRQRLRWGSGYLQVYERLREATQYPAEPRRRMLRELWRRGQVQWTLYQLVCLLPPLVWLLHRGGFIDGSLLPAEVRVALSLTGLVYLAFTFYVLGRYARYMESGRGRGARWVAALHLLVLPLTALCLPTPYTSAMVLKVLGRAPRVWVKTPRTPEVVRLP